MSTCSHKRRDEGCACASCVSKSRHSLPPCGFCTSAGGRILVVTTKSHRSSNVVVARLGAQPTSVHSKVCAHDQTAHAKRIPHVEAAKTLRPGIGRGSGTCRRVLRCSHSCIAGPEQEVNPSLCDRSRGSATEVGSSS